MLLRYVGPLAKVVVAPLDGTGPFLVARGGVSDVPDHVASGLLKQSDMWTTAGEDDSQ